MPGVAIDHGAELQGLLLQGHSLFFPVSPRAFAADYDGVVANAFKGTSTRFCVISFTSDWLFPTTDSRAIVHALNASGARVSFAEIVTDKGHDAFLLDEPELFAIVRGFLESAGRARGLTPAQG